MAIWNNSRQSSVKMPDSVTHASMRVKDLISTLKISSAWISIIILRVIGYLPRRAILLIGSNAGEVFYSINKKRRDIVHKNLEICFPHWPIEKRSQVARQHYRCYGQAIFDLGMLWSASEERLNRCINITGIEHWIKAHNEGKPVILITPHVVAVDMSATMLSRHIPLCTMMKDLRNPIHNAQVIAGRSRFGIKLYKRSGGIGRMIRELRKNGSCYYIPDQDFGAKNSVFVPFFGVQTATLSTLDRIVGMTKAVVMPVRSYLDTTTGYYNITIAEPLQDFPTDDEHVNARRMNAVFEETIKEAPEQYMWTLRWFKTRPDDGPSFY